MDGSRRRAAREARSRILRYELFPIELEDLLGLPILPGYTATMVLTQAEYDAIANAAVVVLGASSATLAPRLSDQGVLTVGDGDCPDNGLVLNLRHDGQRYSFSANPAVAAKAGVSLSSRLLRLAHIVN